MVCNTDSVIFPIVTLSTGKFMLLSWYEPSSLNPRNIVLLTRKVLNNGVLKRIKPTTTIFHIN